jgi:hypothetical protein
MWSSNVVPAGLGWVNTSFTVGYTYSRQVKNVETRFIASLCEIWTMKKALKERQSLAQGIALRWDMPLHVALKGRLRKPI